MNPEADRHFQKTAGGANRLKVRQAVGEDIPAVVDAVKKWIVAE